jgi:hypothetical protein
VFHFFLPWASAIQAVGFVGGCIATVHQYFTQDLLQKHALDQIPSDFSSIESPGKADLVVA